MMRRPRPGVAGSILLALLAAAVVLRLAHGYGWCTECWNWDGRRQNTRDGLRWPAGDGAVITYINGIFHSVPEWEKITGQLEALFGHEVRPFYNPSSGWWITDASKAGYHLLRKPANDTIAQALGEHLAQAVEDVGRGRVLHIAHSGGALITYLAAQNHLTRSQRDKIDVLTFGGARSITRKYFPGRVVNYYARNDPLVRLDRRAAELMKLTNNTTLQSVSDKHESVFVFLEGRARQFVLDHSLEGPTYQHALKKEARAFRRAHFGPLSPLSWDYDTSLVRLARKKFAQVSGIHGFFSTDYWNLRSWRESVTRYTGLTSFFGVKDLPQASVVEHDRQPAMGAQAAGTPKESSWLSSRRGWPWGKGTDEQPNTDSAHSLAVVAQDDIKEWSRWSLGWRWYPGRSEQETAEGVGFGESADPVVDQTPSESPRLGSGRFWNGWGFRPEAVSEPGLGVVDGTESMADASSQGGKSGVTRESAVAGASRGEGNTAGDGNVSPNVDNRPWLSFGWSPWGAAPTSSTDDLQTVPIDSKPMTVDSKGSAGAEQQPAGEEEALKFVLEQSDGPGGGWWWSGRPQSDVEPPAVEEGGNVADVLAEEKASPGAGNGNVEEASTVPQENENVLAGDENDISKSGWWWSSKSQRDVSPATMDGDEVGSGQHGERYAISIDGDSTNAAEVNARLEGNEDTILEGTSTNSRATSWWWAGKTQGEAGSSAAGGVSDPTAGQETDIVDVSDRGPGDEVQGGELSDGIRNVPADTAEEADTRSADQIGRPVLRSWGLLGEYIGARKNPEETADEAAVMSEGAFVEGETDKSLSMFGGDREGVEESGRDTGVNSWWPLGKNRRKSENSGETADVATVVAEEVAVVGELDKRLSMLENDDEAAEESDPRTGARSWWSRGKGIRTSRNPSETADAVAVVAEESALEREPDKPLSMSEEVSGGAEESDRDSESRSWWPLGKGIRTSWNPAETAEAATVVTEESALEGDLDEPLPMSEEARDGAVQSDRYSETRSWWSLGKSIQTSKNPEANADVAAVTTEESVKEGGTDKLLSMPEANGKAAEDSDRDPEAKGWWSLGKSIRTSKTPEETADIAGVLTEKSAAEGETDKLLSIIQADGKGAEDSDHDTEVKMKSAETPPQRQSATRAPVSSWATWRRWDSFHSNHRTAEPSTAGPSAESTGGEEETSLEEETMAEVVLEGERFTAEVILGDEFAPVGLEQDNRLQVKDALGEQGSGDDGDDNGDDGAFDSQVAANSGGDDRSYMAVGDSNKNTLADDNTTRPLLPPTVEDNFIPVPAFDAGEARAEEDAEKTSESYNTSDDARTESAQAEGGTGESRLGDDLVDGEGLAEIGDGTAKSGDKQEGDGEPSRVRRDLSSDAANLDTVDTSPVANIDER